MKKSKCIELVLITAALASCNQPKAKNDWDDNNKVHLRSDTTAPYTRVHHGGLGIGTALLWYYAFRPYGNYNNGASLRRGIFILPRISEPSGARMHEWRFEDTPILPTRSSGEKIYSQNVTQP